MDPDQNFIALRGGLGEVFDLEGLLLGVDSNGFHRIVVLLVRGVPNMLQSWKG